jgi:hypothetical protein
MEMSDIEGMKKNFKVILHAENKRTLKPTQSSLYKLICVTCQDNKGKGGRRKKN